MADTPTAVWHLHQGQTYTCSHPLPDIADTPVFPIHHSRRTTSFHGVAPTPYPCAPKSLPEQWIYTYGCYITGHSRLGAAVVHIPSSTTIYIDDAGIEETRTIMQGELVVIHTALTTFATHEWIGIFMDSLSSLQAIKHHHTNPLTIGEKHYHHHMLLLDSITDLLETNKSAGLRTTLHKIKARTNIRGNDLADAAANVVVTHFDTLPPSQTLQVDIGETSPRPTHC